MSKLYCNIFLLLFVTSGIKSQDSAKFKPGIFVGFDLVRPAIALGSSDQKSYEATVDIRFNKKYFISAEIGKTNIDLNKSTYLYQSEGLFYRLGVNYHFLNLSPVWDRGIFSMACKYGYSYMTHKAPNLTVNDSYWNSYRGNINESTVNSHWLEISTSVRTEIIRNVWFGWTIRMNMILKTNNNGTLKPYYIPGYGKGVFTAFPLVNYYIYYMIPYGK